jgi:hypothetical protein
MAAYYGAVNEHCQTEMIRLSWTMFSGPMNFPDIEAAWKNEVDVYGGSCEQGAR